MSRLPMDWRITSYQALESTQTIVKGAASQGEAEGVVVVSEVQTGGKGRHGRYWESVQGNLHCSFLLRPSCSPHDVGRYALMIGVAVHQALDPLVQGDKRPVLKWPNDVLISGQKCAGILIESDITPDGRVDWLAIGVGVNVALAPLPDTTALAAHSGGVSVDRAAILNAILTPVSELYNLLQAGDFDAVLAYWRAHGLAQGTHITVKNADTHISGTFMDIDDAGNLLLQDDAGETQLIFAGDVFLNQ